MFKKNFSFFLLISILINILPFKVHASLTLNTFNINNISSAGVYFNPGDTFSIDAYGTNDLIEEIKDVRVKVDFTNNSSFVYSGSDQKTQVHFADTVNPVPLGDYSSSTGLNTAVSTSNVPVGNYIMLSRASNNYTGFTISSTASNYSNVVTTWFEGAKVSDSSAVVGTSQTKTIYINVKPHIVDRYFEKSGVTATTLKTGGSDSIDFVVKVKDYNGCSNIDGGSVIADLSLLGLGSAESLTYDSCSGNIASFKKSGITTLVPIGSYTITSSKITATDENGNVNNSGDSNFVESGETNSVIITVESAGASVVTNGGLSDNYIGGTGETSSTLTLSANQSGLYKVALNSCNETTSIFQNWTTYTTPDSMNVVIPSSGLVEGNNTVFACVDNELGDIGSFNVTLTKDTVAPTISSLSNTSSVVSGNASVSYSCNENGYYKIAISNGSGTSITTDYTSTTANASISTTVSNGSLDAGVNSLIVYCKDNAGNETSNSTRTITKQIATPSMVGEVTSLSDSDIDNNGIDGRDINIVWNSSIGSSFTGFESWRIYLLPSSVTLNTTTHNYIKLIATSGSGSFIGDSSITTDSAGNSLVGGASYKAYVAIMGTSGNLGTPGASASVILTSDTVLQASVTSAQFISDTQLKIFTDTTLDTATGSHDASRVTYTVGGNSKTATTVESITGQNMILTIPSLGDTGVVGTNLSIAINGLHSAAGGYNNSITGISISDAQSPTLSGFSNNTSPISGNFYNSSVNLSWTNSETLIGGQTYFSFERISGNADSTPHNAYISATADLASGSHTKTININSQATSTDVLLTCGTLYQLKLLGTDSAGNIGNSSYISNIGFDNCAPTAPVANEFTTLGDTSVDFTWTASTDDGGNGSGIANYTVGIYNGSGCSSLNNSYSVGTNSKNLTVSSGDYSWKVSATDNVGNVSAFSSCDDFTIDTNIPTFSSQSITDTSLSSVLYVKSGNPVEVKANITNTDIGNITADVRSLTGNASHSAVSCSSPDTGIACSYVGTTVTYSFISGFGGALSGGTRQVQIIANNTNGINQQTSLFSTTVDTASPVVNSAAITYPNGGEIIGGDSLTLTWDNTKITDTIGLQKVEVSYLKGGVDQGIIYSGPNSGSYIWDITSLVSATDYSIQIKAYDNVGNTATDISNADFTIDRNGPTVGTSALTAPNGGVVYKGGNTVSITWNSAGITDVGGLATNPIRIQYSADNGVNYTDIVTNEANDGTYNWTVPSINSAQVLVKIIVEDSAGNTAEDVSDTTFIIDSSVPSQTLTYVGAGGNTPQNGAFINNSGINITGTTSDSYLSTLKYRFQNITDGTYWDGTNYVGGLSEVTLCTDSVLLGSNTTCNTFSELVNPTIEDAKSYKLVLISEDESGNKKESIDHLYTGDIVNPVLNITTSSGSYVSSTISILGTSSDAGSGLSSVSVQIKKGTDYWDGLAFVATTQTLSTTTSDSYTNWSYSFIPPVGDSDGQVYTITVLSYDSALKDSNATSSSIVVVKDSTGPVIGSTVISTPTSGDINAGGDTITINWLTGVISDSISGLVSTPITLQYFNGSSYTTIASGLANSGTYSWSNIPAIDSSNVHIRITVADNAGNTSFKNGSTFTIDSTAPSIVSVQTMEYNISNGSINALQITFSENVVDSGINYNDFSINSGAITPTGLSTGGVANDNKITILFADTGDTGTTPTLSYSGTSIVDFAGKLMGATGNITSIDRATPRMQSVKAFDNNSNGKLDSIEVNYSEALSFSTSISGVTLNNAFAGMSIASLSVSGTKLIYSLNESTGYDTTTTGLTFTLGSTSYVDTSGNSVGTFSGVSIEDFAPPVKVLTQTFDNNSNYKADTVTLTFSETITGENIGDFTLLNLSAGSTVASIASSGTKVNVTLNETTDNNDTVNAITVAYGGTNLVDGNGNQVTAISTHTSNDMIPAKILSRETVDSNGDGYIDGIIVTTSENLNDNFSSINISVNGYTVSSYTSGTANDEIFIINVTPLSTIDTSATPNVKVLSNSSLGDASNNKLLIESVAVSSSDGVGPIIVGVRYDEGTTGVSDDILYITFSESIDASSIDTSVGGASNDFEITSGGVLGGNATTTITSATTVSILLGAGSTALTSGTSKVGIKTAALSDTFSNNSPVVSSVNRMITSASVVINEVMFATNTNDQYIELRNLGASSIDISGWVIENAGGNGIDLTISSGTIPGNGYFLISKVAETSNILSVTPDFVSSTLNLNDTTQTNLVLTDTVSIFDTIKSSPWPEGNNSIPTSMERKNNPGNGTDITNWYTAQTSVGFDSGTPLGTPGVVNVFDADAPTINSQFPLDNDLIPTAAYVRFDYSDSGLGVDSTTYTISFQKWGGASYNADSSGVDIITNDVDNSRAIFTLDDLSAGKYKAIFSIADISGNTVNQTVEFYIDRFYIKLDTNAVDIGDVDSGGIVFSQAEAILTLHTLGAGFIVTQSKGSLMSAGSETILDYDGSFGFGFDIYKDEDNVLSNYTNTLTAISGSNIANISKNIDTSGNIKNYTYKMKYGAKIPGMQTPGKYTTDITYNTILTY